MEQVKPTRMELMKKKAQIRLAEQGRDLLREKMDALIQEFFKILSTVSDSRDELELVSQAADQALLIAQATDDLVTLKSAGLATRRSITVGISGKNIMGVPVPVIEKKRISKSMLERGYGVITTSARIDETAGLRDPDEPEARECARADPDPRAQEPGEVHQERHRGAGAGGPVPFKESEEYP